MAADTRLTAKNFIIAGEAKKIFQLDHALVGIGGDADESINYNEAFNTLKLPEDIPEWLESLEKEGAKWELLIVFKNWPNMVFLCKCDKDDHVFWSTTLDEGKGMALGSGCDYAEAAMTMGATAEEAVFVAMEHDASTGGSVIAYDL
jgi:ATP-dependent protease HslVU (ClpYQ) peptidase subunit